MLSSEDFMSPLLHKVYVFLQRMISTCKGHTGQKTNEMLARKWFTKSEVELLFNTLIKYNQLTRDHYKKGIKNGGEMMPYEYFQPNLHVVPLSAIEKFYSYEFHYWQASLNNSKEGSFEGKSFAVEKYLFDNVRMFLPFPPTQTKQLELKSINTLFGMIGSKIKLRREKLWNKHVRKQLYHKRNLPEELLREIEYFMGDI